MGASQPIATTAGCPLSGSETKSLSVRLGASAAACQLEKRIVVRGRAQRPSAPATEQETRQGDEYPRAVEQKSGRQHISAGDWSDHCAMQEFIEARDRDRVDQKLADIGGRLDQ